MKKITLFCVAVLTCSSVLTFAGNRTNVVIPGEHFPKAFRMDPRVKEGDYLPNTIIFKVKPEYRQNCKVNSIDNILRLQDLLNAVSAQNFAKIYPNHRAPEKQFNEIGLKLVDISLIYSFEFTSNQKLEKVINQFLALGYFEFVEPWYVPKVLYVPSEGSTYNQQYHLKGNVVGSVDAQGAWTITKGSASVVIGIVDTGTQKAHPDLAGNYIGGYDVAMNDADPEYVSNDHGVRVSGDACEVTDNGVGGAGPGFNCKFKAVKIARDSDGSLIAGYEGITWAADNGCKIINCSWGGPAGTAYGQTIIDYAAINKNCLVVCAAGNGATEELLWPGSFNNAYRVAMTTSSDAKAGLSSYGVDVDFGAPGSGIYSTAPGGYGPSDGTSMASPVASGVAGLIQSQFNYTNAMQIGERLKQTCDPYASGSTTTLFNQGKLGNGRIDAARAVNASIAAKSIIMNPINITDGNDNIFFPNEVLTISGTFINLLDPTSTSATSVLSIVSGPGTITNANCAVGAMATLATKATPTPFTVTIQAGAAVNSIIKFKVTITDGAFSGTQNFEVTVNPDYVNIVNNDVHTSITSKGRIGYNFDSQVQGLGFSYKGTTPGTEMLYEMSLMIGASSTKVSDMFREGGTGNSDFVSSTRAYQVNPATVSDFDVDGKFTDGNSPAPIPVQVHHSAYAWSTAPYRKFVIVKYVIKNTGASTLSNLAVGIVADWDIVTASANKSGYDPANTMGYCYDVAAGGTYAGLKLLGAKTSSNAPIGFANHYAMDLYATPAGGGGVDAGDDYTTAEKYTTLTTVRNTDNFSAAGGDVMSCMSSKGLTIPAGDSITVAFALIGGDNLADIQLSACQAQNKYDGTTNPCLVGVDNVESTNFWMYSFPNPTTGSFNIDYNLVGHENTTISIMNTLGETVMIFNNLLQGENTLTVDASGLSSGTYFYQLRSGEAMLTKKLTIVR